VNSIAASGSIVEAGGIYEVVIGAACEERVGKLAEELFEKASYTVDIVVEGCRVTEVDDLGVCKMFS
jgi:hypothetical protein